LRSPTPFSLVTGHDDSSASVIGPSAIPYSMPKRYG
jgi:hypothetical protein